MAYSAPRTWAAHDKPTAAQFNQDIRDNVSFLANPPAVKCLRTTTQSINNAASTAVLWTSEQFDTASMHESVTNPSRITITTAGMYVITAGIAFATNTTGQRNMDFLINASVLAGQVQVTAASGTADTYLTMTILDKLAVNDYVECRVFQNSGGALNFLGEAGHRRPFFSAVWVGLG